MICMVLMPKKQEVVFSYLCRLCRSGFGEPNLNPGRFASMPFKDLQCPYKDEALLGYVRRLTLRKKVCGDE